MISTRPDPSLSVIQPLHDQFYNLREAIQLEQQVMNELMRPLVSGIMIDLSSVTFATTGLFSVLASAQRYAKRLNKKILVTGMDQSLKGVLLSARLTNDFDFASVHLSER